MGRAATRDFRARADDILSGWYLVEEHIAEVVASQGDLERAVDMYRDILARVPNGEFYDALADVLQEAGKTEEARQARERARRAYNSDLEAFPEAAYGHAVDHFLVHGPAPKALELARANWALRSTPEARITLVQALVRSGQVDTAREQTEKLLESPWKTPELHATAARVFELAGAAERTQKQRRLAEDLRSGASEEFEWLVASAAD